MPDEVFFGQRPEQDEMPIYAFRCRGCGLEFEELVLRVGQTAPCPQCGSKDVERQVSIPAAHRSHDSTGGPACGAPPRSGFS